MWHEWERREKFTMIGGKAQRKETTREDQGVDGMM
jgi:hypothetical protein